MKKQAFYSDAPNQRETRWGLVYLAVSLVVLPALLQAGNRLLAAPLSDARLNFIYYCINFAAVVWIFRRFLGSQLRAALRIPFPTLWYAALGYLGSRALGEILAYLIFRVFPSFVNVNDRSIAQLLNQDFRLMAAATIVLVPIAEETLYRGLVFRCLYGKAPLPPIWCPWVYSPPSTWWATLAASARCTCCCALSSISRQASVWPGATGRPAPCWLP